MEADWSEELTAYSLVARLGEHFTLVVKPNCSSNFFDAWGDALKKMVYKNIT